MRFRRSVTFALMAFMCLSAADTVEAFDVKNDSANSGEDGDVRNRNFEEAAIIDARTYICGTHDSSDNAIEAGMRETGLPEDIAVEIVSDLASGLVDKASQSGSKLICRKAAVQLSDF
ncbi:hypothetical protein [Phyllobacterium endophyticum]|uniref:hypothetical protein n=1 Tax=Phyllobacterium endophyticum TaxID=1149773 RepID=UPI0011CB66F7|nr:hypothetical protein [Phyllobacterium endophyticum]TXR46504.1 hypothetical protein FVA77_24760 [Phyllobacterium endophyticum]